MKLQFRAAWMLDWLTVCAELSWAEMSSLSWLTELTDWLTDLVGCLAALDESHSITCKLKLRWIMKRLKMLSQARRQTINSAQLISTQLNSSHLKSPSCNCVFVAKWLRAKIQNWCEFHKSVSGSALINDSAWIEGTYRHRLQSTRLTFWCFMTSTCKSHSRKVLSQQATANSQQLHHCATIVRKERGEE